MNTEALNNLVKEIRIEQAISPRVDNTILINIIKEGIYNINYSTGANIDYSSDLNARSLLKNYVFYATYNRLAEFKELYTSDYASLQLKYNRDASLS